MTTTEVSTEARTTDHFEWTITCENDGTCDIWYATLDWMCGFYRGADIPTPGHEDTRGDLIDALESWEEEVMNGGRMNDTYLTHM